LEVVKESGFWVLRKKGTVTEKAAEPMPPMPEEYGTITSVAVGRSCVTVEWEVDDDGVYFETYWTRRYDKNFKFIADAEKAAAKAIEKKIGKKILVNGGTGTIGYRSTTANIKGDIDE
jgi:hypothetical protein